MATAAAKEIPPSTEPAAEPALERLRPAELPAPPQVAIRVMQACSQDDSDSRRIATLVGSDPGLTAEILRVVNSAYFGFSQKVTSIGHAVSILGNRALRNYVLCIAVREALSPDALHGNDTVPFWWASLHRAVAARLLGEHRGLDAGQCFTVGLLLDIGMAALFHTRPDLAGEWDGFLRADPDTRLQREKEMFGITHDVAGGVLARAWALPDEIAQPIAAHHRAVVGAEGGDLMRIAKCADWLAAVFACEGQRPVIRQARGVLAHELQLSEEEADALLSRLPDEVSAAGESFGFDVVRGPQFDTLLRDANLTLAEENIGFQEMTWRLQSTLDERDELAQRLKQEVDTARVVQRSLLPGGGAAAEGPVDDGPFSGLNSPARELSGDFYDHFTLADGRSYFCLADVSGKGMDAALLMAKASSLFHCLGKLVHDPRKLLTLINAELLETSVRGMFVTMIAGLYDPVKKVVLLVNAGHPPPLIVSAEGRVSVGEVQAPPLGVVPDFPYALQEHAVAECAMYLFSDGLLEAPGKNGDRLGYDGIVQVLRSLRKVERTERLARLLTTVGRTHDLCDDDVTLLMVES